jgi:hypothetical protein
MVVQDLTLGKKMYLLFGDCDSRKRKQKKGRV